MYVKTVGSNKKANWHKLYNCKQMSECLFTKQLFINNMCTMHTIQLKHGQTKLLDQGDYNLSISHKCYYSA